MSEFSSLFNFPIIGNSDKQFYKNERRNIRYSPKYNEPMIQDRLITYRSSSKIVGDNHKGRHVNHKRRLYSKLEGKALKWK